MARKKQETSSPPDPADKPRRGRPPNRGVAATERLEVRVTPEQLALYKHMADESSMSLSAWSVCALDTATGQGPARAEIRRLKLELARVAATVAEL